MLRQKPAVDTFVPFGQDTGILDIFIGGRRQKMNITALHVTIESDVHIYVHDEQTG